MTKRINRDGEELIKIPSADLYDGVCDVLVVSGLLELSQIIKSLQPNQALAYGVPTLSGVSITVTTMSKVTKGMMARSRDYMHWPESTGIMMLDYDPHPGAAPLTPEELVQTIRGAVPELNNVEMLWTPSASSCIKSADGIIDTGISGQRLYMEVHDARRIPEFGQILFNRLWLAGYGYMFHTATGTALFRTLVDSSVWQPERLDFVAGAVCGEGLTRNAVDHLHFEAEPC